MATLASLVADVREMLYGMARIERPAEDTLATQVTNATDVAWRFTTTTMWKRGDYAEFYDGTTAAPEVVILAADHGAGADVAVRRGQRNTTAKVGTYEIGDVFLHHGSQASSYTQVQMERAINEVIRNDLWPWVWYVAERILTAANHTATDTVYTLAATDEDVVAMYQYNINSSNAFHPFHRSWWQVVGSVNTAVNATGKILRIHRVHSTDDDIYYTTKSRPAAATDLSTELADMVPWKATAKLLGTRGAQNAVAPLRRRRELQDSVRDYLFFDQEFRRMRDMERERLLSLTPPQSRFLQAPRVG